MVAIVVVIVAASSAFAFDIGKLLNNKPKEPDKFAIIRVDRLASLMNDPNSHVNIYDANGWGLRSTAGVIPARICSPATTSMMLRRSCRLTKARSSFSTAPICIELHRMKPPGGRNQQDTAT